MIEKEEVVVPEKKCLQTVAIHCDICKERRHHATNYGTGVDWNEGYDKTETAVILKKSSGGQYGGSGDVWEYHVCGKCFQERLEPFLKSLGAEPTTYDFDW